MTLFHIVDKNKETLKTMGSNLAFLIYPFPGYAA
jgi:hypothetical protein